MDLLIKDTCRRTRQTQTLSDVVGHNLFFAFSERTLHHLRLLAAGTRSSIQVAAVLLSRYRVSIIPGRPMTDIKEPRENNVNSSNSAPPTAQLIDVYAIVAAFNCLSMQRTTPFHIAADIPFVFVNITPYSRHICGFYIPQTMA